MTTPHTLRREPWTCKWGRFGGPIEATIHEAPGFVFWTCAHPEEQPPRPLNRGTCEQCPRWEVMAGSEEPQV